MNYVASSFGAAWTNFVSSQAVSVNCGSNAGRFIVGISTATNGGTAAARNLSSANYGGVGLTLSAVESNNFGSYFQAAHGATTLTGANDFQAVCANNDGGIFVAAAAFDGCAASPLSGLVKSGADNSAPTATVSSATGRTVYAIVVEIGTQSTLTPGAGVTVLATADASTSRFHLLSIAGGSSVTVGGTFAGTRSWSMWAWSLEALSAAPVITGPSGAAGAASITHAVNELQANAGTWSATGGSAWSLTGTDAGLLSISSGGVVTLASGNFDRETRASYSFNVLRGAVAQAVTLNINNVNEAPTFNGPDISVPGLVVGVAMSSINAALLFADPDAGDTGTYSAVGTWPAGVTVNSAGLISGTPTTPGTSSSLRVRRTDGGALTADSNLFSITVSAPGTAPTITVQPANQTVTAGATAGFSVTATGSGLTYQWRRNGTNIGGATSSSYTTPATTVSGGSANNGDLYSVVVTGDTAPAATSSNATLTVNAGAGLAGFDFHTAAGCIFGAISGSLVGLSREVGVSITTRVYSATTGALVATLPATATDSNGRLPRLTDAALVAATNYRLVFVWPDGACYALNLAAT